MVNWKKLNPCWWIGNDDDPVPPGDMWPDDPQWLRKLRWAFRNPLHNFTFYVIGVADQDFARTSEGNWNPAGGWLTAIITYKWLWLPYVSYKGTKWEFYLGWRERGNFGVTLRK
jgi:hypothetical protein